MKTSKKAKGTLYMVEASMIAALYIATTFLQEMILRGSASGVIQIRLSELLCTLAALTPAAIPGLSIGCLVANLLTMGAMPLDVIIGSFATLMAAICAYKLRKTEVFSVPLLSLLMPVLFNAVIIGLELEIFFIEGDFTFVGFLTQATFVAIGEFVACVIAGIPFYLVVKKLPIFRDKN